MTKVISALDSFQLFYEELEKKKVTKKQSKVLTDKPKKTVVTTPLKTKIYNLVSGVVAKIVSFVVKTYNKLPRFKHLKKYNKKLTKSQKQAIREQQVRGILGIGLLFVVVSITYSSYVIFNGVDSSASRLMLAPQVVFALITLFKAFSKIYK